MLENLHVGIIDISIILLGILFSISGFKNGFFKELKGIIAFIGAIVLTFFLADFVKNIITDSPVQLMIYDFFFDGMFSSNATYATVIDDSLPNALTLLQEGLVDLGVPSFLAGTLASTLIVFDGTIGAALATVTTNIIVLIASYLVTFLVLWILMSLILGQIVSLTKTIKFIRFFDSLLGIFLGLGRAALIIAVFFIIAIPLSITIGSVNDFLTQDLSLGTEKFSIGKYIFEFALGIFDNIL
jgi:uncharacterized membrane protein required for colicin V production